ncbi:hypothetical protein MNBD_GAMMA11-2165, partial [hydrothermal vent metagenome]
MTDPVNLSGRSLTGSISNSTGRSAAKANSAASPESSSSNSLSGATASAEDTVSLSAGSQQVIELQQQLKTAAEIDRTKIDAIKQEIANGNY